MFTNGYLLWVAALALFVIADVVGLLTTWHPHAGGLRLLPGGSFSHVFDVTDLFAVGVGCDFAGAYLLGRGLLKTPLAIRRLGTWGAHYPGAIMDGADDHVTATVGVAALLGGFAFQALAYALVLGVGSTSDASLGRALVAVVAAAVPCIAILVAERATHRGRVDKLLLRVGVEDAATNTPRAAPAIDEFVQIAEWRNDERLAGEDDRAFVARVFEVDVTEWADELNPPRTADN
jgi:hypothetical protein